MVLGLLFARRAWDVVLESWEFGAKDTSALSIPLIIPQGLWAVGISVFCVLTVMIFLETLLLLLLGQQGMVDQRLGSRSIEEETEEALGAVGMTHVPHMQQTSMSDSNAAEAGRE
jgi:hypothetical protein